MWSMNAAAQVLFSLGFGLLYWEMATGLERPNAGPVAILAIVAYLLAFFIPQALFRFTLSEAAPAVMSQLSKRLGIAAAITLALGLLVAAILVPGAPSAVPIVMEIYSATFMGLIIFHAMGGLMAEQANYLQRTAQYKSDQLLAVVVAMSVLFILLTMYFLAFDLGVARAPRIYVRDMIFGTLAFAGFAWVIYRLGHH
jgi:hypothetical protein